MTAPEQHLELARMPAPTPRVHADRATLQELDLRALRQLRRTVGAAG